MSDHPRICEGCCLAFDANLNKCPECERIYYQVDRYNNQEILQMINDCFDREEQLSDWERGFMSTCLDMADKNIMLSEKQLEILNRTWEKVTDNG